MVTDLDNALLYTEKLLTRSWPRENLAALRRVVEAARLVANPNIEQWIEEVVLALDAATKIGQRSCNSGDHLHYANHDRLIASAPNLAALTPGGDTKPTRPVSGEPGSVVHALLADTPQGDTDE